MESFNFKGGRKLELENEEVQSLSYQLQLATNGKVAFPEMDVYKIENLDYALQFQRTYADCLKVPCWLKTSELGYENNIEHVSKRGLTFPNAAGMKFSTGCIELPGAIRNGKPVDTILIFCEVAVGRAFVADDVEYSRPLPPGYDSYYCPLQPLDRDQDGSFSISEYAAAATFDGRNPS